MLQFRNSLTVELKWGKVPNSEVWTLKKLANAYEQGSEKSFNKQKNEMAQNAGAYFKDIDNQIEKEVFASLLTKVVDGVDAAMTFPYLKDKLKLYQRNYVVYTNDLFNQSSFTCVDSLSELCKLNYPEWMVKVKADPVWNFYEELNYFTTYGIQKRAGELEDNIANLRRQHMAALMKVFPERKFYPLDILIT